ncbi:hypothetical protein INT43_007498 [Umbelopsis isabellina]|uniref:Galactose oxidase n=1 Tax=Mortierella isabellina TaxID=91625 RepID=A0A8H7PYF8_MORIS|nr:hypothetical protein INT43_007498 [Umbelopsis isabellina]
MLESSNMILSMTVVGCLMFMALASQAPPTRWATNCAIVQTSIYCYGGDNRVAGVDTTLSDTWALDVGSTFAVSHPSWTNISWSNLPNTPRALGTMNALTDGISLVINGGVTAPAGLAEINQTIAFNTVTKDWKAINSSLIAQTRDHQSVIDANDKIWYFGGLSDLETGRTNISYWQGLAALDTVSWQWTTSRGTNGGYLNSRIGHTMTILPNGMIYIIGGDMASLLPGLDSRRYLQWSLTLAPMGSIVAYDTVKGIWTTPSATGTIPPSRNFHSATLGQDNKTIIIFGGAAADNQTTGDSDSTLFNDLYTLDSDNMNWTHINIENAPSARFGHSAVQVNETMLILFGANSTNNSLSDINALDTVNWKWVQHFSASGYTQQSNNSSPAAANGTLASANDSTTSNSLGAGAIAGIAVGGVVVVAAVVVLLLLRRSKKNKKRGSHGDDFQTELVANNSNTKMGGSLASPQKHWYDANFRGTEPVEALPSGYHTYNAKPNVAAESVIDPHSKPDEYY